jgi:hypothetical protein
VQVREDVVRLIRCWRRALGPGSPLRAEAGRLSRRFSALYAARVRPPMHQARRAAPPSLHWEF